MPRLTHLISFLTLLIFPISNAFVIDCYYNEWDWNFKQKVYECQGNGLELDKSPGYVVDVREIHMTGGNLTEVEALRFLHRPQITFLPNGIGKYFPNLKGLSFLNCNIKTISKDHLAEFPMMFQVSYSHNMIEYVPGDTFIYTPRIRLVNFAGNNIKRIGTGLLKPLKNLEYVWFEKNLCVNMNARKSDFKTLRQIIRENCTPDELKECSRIPKIITKWNETKAEEFCEFIQVYKFKVKPFHELEKFEREKVEKERKEREDYIRTVLKISEHPDAIYRFFEIIYTKNMQTNDTDIIKAAEQTREKKIVESLMNLVKKNDKINKPEKELSFNYDG